MAAAGLVLPVTASKQRAYIASQRRVRKRHSSQDRLTEVDRRRRSI
jgi:hypothetical protein